MFNGRRIGFLWIIFFAASTVVKAKTKYYDGEARPYEFGYRIEGNQHRHEKKDADGIINGEFGFITGDGVYHQTVYATDENGNFKLVSLKTSFKFEKPTTTTAPPTTTSPPAPSSAPPHSVKLLKSCSDCRVFERVVHDKTGEDVTGSRTGKGEAVEISMPITPNINDLPKMRINSNNGTIGTISPMNIALGISSAGIRASEEIKLKRKEITKSKGNISAPNRNGPSVNKASPRNNEHDNTKTPNEIPPPHPTSKPVHSAQVVIPVSLQTKSEITVPVSTDHITNNKPVESSKTHLSSKQEINHFIGDVLYRFNYTAGYHGHNEEGDSAGNKRGGYFIVGRDNIRRGVIYVANENGFVPMVRYEKVSPAEAPHEDSEKSGGLRGYEFEWFHKGKSRGDSVNDSRR